MCSIRVRGQLRECRVDPAADKTAMMCVRLRLSMCCWSLWARLCGSGRPCALSWRYEPTEPLPGRASSPRDAVGVGGVDGPDWTQLVDRSQSLLSCLSPDPLPSSVLAWLARLVVGVHRTNATICCHQERPGR